MFAHKADKTEFKLILNFSQVINRGLLFSAAGAVLGGSYLLIKNPPDINKLVLSTEKMWNRLVALRTP